MRGHPSPDRILLLPRCVEAERTVLFDTARIKSLLEGAGIPWAVAAGAAVYLYAGNRLPTDLDILVRPEDLHRVGQLLGVVSKTGEAPWGEVSKVDLGEIEIVGSLVVKRGAESYRYWMDDEMVRHLRSATFQGVQVPVLAPEDVVALKAVLQRGLEQGKHDLEDIAALAAKVEIDRGYLRLRLQRMGAVERAKPLLERWGWEGASAPEPG